MKFAVPSTGSMIQWVSASRVLGQQVGQSGTGAVREGGVGVQAQRGDGDRLRGGLELAVAVGVAVVGRVGACLHVSVQAGGGDVVGADAFDDAQRPTGLLGQPLHVLDLVAA
ncbi:hypothetical protein J2S50_007460 [Streptomyces sp. DSM 40167]|nr:hypothetical protein [Streptomyces sp. DSM 40167]MDQ0408828.1 hypothetical protein [Streptomyces sp. DSM 40167]